MGLAVKLTSSCNERHDNMLAINTKIDITNSTRRWNRRWQLYLTFRINCSEKCLECLEIYSKLKSKQLCTPCQLWKIQTSMTGILGNRLKTCRCQLFEHSVQTFVPKNLCWKVTCRYRNEIPMALTPVSNMQLSSMSLAYNTLHWAKAPVFSTHRVLQKDKLDRLLKATWGTQKRSAEPNKVETPPQINHSSPDLEQLTHNTIPNPGSLFEIWPTADVILKQRICIWKELILSADFICVCVDKRIRK